jgi:hypothetical protein
VVSDTTNLNPVIVARLKTLSESPVRWPPCWAHVFDLMNGDVIAASRDAVEPLMPASQLFRPSADYARVWRRAAAQCRALPTYVEIRWRSMNRLLVHAKERRAEIEEAFRLRHETLVTDLRRRFKQWMKVNGASTEQVIGALLAEVAEVVPGEIAGRRHQSEMAGGSVSAAFWTMPR